MNHPFLMEKNALAVCKSAKDCHDPMARLAGQCIEDLLTETARLRSIIAGGSEVPVATPDIVVRDLDAIRVLLQERNSGLAIIIPAYTVAPPEDMARRELERRYQRWVWGNGGPLP